METNTKIGLWRGKPVEEMTREELIEALVALGGLYASQISTKEEYNCPGGSWPCKKCMSTNP